jgi:hypothetical protein
MTILVLYSVTLCGVPRFVTAFYIRERELGGGWDGNQRKEDFGQMR